jgi:16S rRNA (uracil1498-N3)-methyltransferase
MARRRFFVDAIRGGAAELRGDEARHLTRVLRVEAGQRFEITDQQSVWLAEIVEARGEHVVFRVVEPLESAETPVRVTLYAALIKFDRFEWLVEKATELGIEAIQPLEAVRTERGLYDASRKRSERWQRIAREAGQQSRRLRAPAILPAVRWQAALAGRGSLRYLLDESTAPPLLRILPESRMPRAEVSLLTGPEGGWTEAERQAAVAAGWQPASLGPQILRAETAAIAAIAIVINAWLP